MISAIETFFVSAWAYICSFTGVMTLYIPTQIPSSIDQAPIANYYYKGGAPQQIVDFYWAFFRYMPTTSQATNVLRHFASKGAEWIYSLDAYLQNMYLHLFDLMGLGWSGESKQIMASKSGQWNIINWYHWSEEFACGICVIMVIFYIIGTLIAFNTDTFKRYRTLLYDMILISFFFGFLPTLTTDFANATETVANDVLGSHAGQADIAQRIIMNNVVSVPHYVINQEETELAHQTNSKGGGSSKLAPIPINDPNVKPISGTPLFTSSDISKGSGSDPSSKPVPAVHYSINIEQMSDNDAQLWNGIDPHGPNKNNGLQGSQYGNASVDNFLNNYGTQDNILNKTTIAQIGQTQLNAVEQQQNNSENKHETNDNAKTAKENKGHGALYKGLNNAKNDLDKTGSKIASKIGNAAGDTNFGPMKGSTAQSVSNITTPFEYYISNTQSPSMCKVDQFRQFSSSLSKYVPGSSFVSSAYNMYSVSWINIYVGLIILGLVFIMYTFKLLKTFFKATIMYIASSILIAKDVGNPSKTKAYFRNFFSLYEMLVFDVVIIKVFFICYFAVQSLVGSILGFGNPTIASIMEALLDIMLFVASISGVNAVSQALGQPTGAAGGGWMSAMFGLRMAGGLAKGAFHAPGAVASKATSLVSGVATKGKSMAAKHRAGKNAKHLNGGKHSGRTTPNQKHNGKNNPKNKGHFKGSANNKNRDSKKNNGKNSDKNKGNNKNNNDIKKGNRNGLGNNSSNHRHLSSKDSDKQSSGFNKSNGQSSNNSKSNSQNSGNSSSNSDNSNNSEPNNQSSDNSLNSDDNESDDNTQDSNNSNNSGSDSDNSEPSQSSDQTNQGNNEPNVSENDTATNSNGNGSNNDGSSNNTNTNTQYGNNTGYGSSNSNGLSYSSNPADHEDNSSIHHINDTGNGYSQNNGSTGNSSNNSNGNPFKQDTGTGTTSTNNANGGSISDSHNSGFTNGSTPNGSTGTVGTTNNQQGSGSITENQPTQDTSVDNSGGVSGSVDGTNPTATNNSQLDNGYTETEINTESGTGSPTEEANPVETKGDIGGGEPPLPSEDDMPTQQDNSLPTGAVSDDSSVTTGSGPKTSYHGNGTQYHNNGNQHQNTIQPDVHPNDHNSILGNPTTEGNDSNDQVNDPTGNHNDRPNIPTGNSNSYGNYNHHPNSYHGHISDPFGNGGNNHNPFKNHPDWTNNKYDSDSDSDDDSDN